MTALWVEAAKRDGCGVLPRPAERELMAAARVGSEGSLVRQRAIDRAYTKTSAQYPELFKD